MNTYAISKKESVPVLRRANPYLHRPMGHVEQVQREEIGRILRSAGALAKHSNQITSLVNRQVELSGEEELKTKSGSDKTPTVNSMLEARINSMNGGGQPLSGNTRHFFESRMGHDFSHVRVHSDHKAADVAQSLQARAFTRGSNLVFGAGQYQPHTREGRRLLGHELTHVLQQKSGGDSVNRIRLYAWKPLPAKIKRKIKHRQIRDIIATLYAEQTAANKTQYKYMWYSVKIRLKRAIVFRRNRKLTRRRVRIVLMKYDAYSKQARLRHRSARGRIDYPYASRYLRGQNMRTMARRGKLNPNAIIQVAKIVLNDCDFSTATPRLKQRAMKVPRTASKFYLHWANPIESKSLNRCWRNRRRRYPGESPYKTEKKCVNKFMLKKWRTTLSRIIRGWRSKPSKNRPPYGTMYLGKM